MAAQSAPIGIRLKLSAAFVAVSLVIAGFVIVGTGPKRVLVRGLGPRLQEAPFNYAYYGEYMEDGISVSRPDLYFNNAGYMFKHDALDANVAYLKQSI